MPDELLPCDDDIDPRFCHRCNRYAWCDNGNERLLCQTTGEWLCPECSNVSCPYPEA